MRAVDVNVILRLITGDDPAQEARARAVIEAETVLVPLTVTLECEWVLRSFYRWSREQIASAIDAMTDVDHIVFEHVEGVRWALNRMEAGGDFADMVHIVQASGAGASGFVTFDGGIPTEAGPDTPITVESLTP